MNIFTYPISLTTYMTKEKLEANNEAMIECRSVEFGRFKLPDSYTVKVIKNIISDISTTPVSYNWWIDFSTWGDFRRIKFKV